MYSIRNSEDQEIMTARNIRDLSHKWFNGLLVSWHSELTVLDSKGREVPPEVISQKWDEILASSSSPVLIKSSLRGFKTVYASSKPWFR